MNSPCVGCRARTDIRRSELFGRELLPNYLELHEFYPGSAGCAHALRRSKRVGGDVVADIAAEHADGGPDRQSRENGEPFHRGITPFAIARDIVLIRRRRRNIRVIGRHDFCPQDRDSLATKLAPGGVRICGRCVSRDEQALIRTHTDYSTGWPSSLPFDRLMK